MALKWEDALFIFALQPLPVIYLMRPREVQRIDDLQRDARVRGQLTLPPRLDRLLALTQALLPAKEG